MFAWWKTCRPYGVALAIFLASRLVVYIAVHFALIYVRHGAGADLWDAGPAWYHHLLRWDSGWYADIVDHGYAFAADTDQARNAVFYPLYPLVAKAVTLFGIGTFVALLIVANVAAVCAALMLFRLVRTAHDEETAFLAVAALGFFPTSLFLSAGYSEPLALVFILGCFLLLQRGRLVPAALCAGFAFDTRSTGLVLLPAILWQVWTMYRDSPAKLVRSALLCTLLATSGLTLYMIYLWLAVGDPLRFATMQSHWHGDTSLRERLGDALMLKPLFGVPSEGLIYFVGSLAVLVGFWRRLDPAQALFALGVLMLPYLTLASGPSGFGSMPRFVLLAFPLFIIVAQLCRQRAWLTTILTALGTAGLFGYAAAFAQWHWSG